MRRKHRWTPAKGRRAAPAPATDDAIWPLAEDVEANLDAELARARSLIEVHDGFDVVANTLLANLPHDPDTYKESTHRGLVVLAELAALLVLTTGRRTPPGLTPRQTIQISTTETNADLDRVLRDCLALGQLLNMVHVQRLTDRDAASIGLLQRFREVLVRGPAYPHQEEETLRDLFTPFSAELEEVVGFTIDQALAMTHAAGTGMIERNLERIQAAQAGRAEAAAILEEDGIGNVDEVAEWAMKAWAFSFLGSTMSVTPDELAADAKVPPAAAQAFLDYLSIGFGTDVSPQALFRGINPLRRRPFLVDEAGNYLLVSPPNLRFDLRGALEETLKTTPYWKRYDKHRASYVERAAIDALARALRPDLVLRNVFWRDGNDVVETDGLILIDDVLLIVEAKGKAFRETASRGLPAHLTHDLKAIVTEAAEQVKRLRRRIATDGSLTLVHRKNADSILDLTKVRDVLGITVALEDISILTTADPDLARLGLRGGRRAGEPLALPLHTLLVMCEIVVFPAQLIQYLLRRDRLVRQGNVFAHEELDFFMYYLNKGLFFDPMKPNKFISLQSMTDDLDAYYMALHGDRSAPAPKPAQVIPPHLQDLILQLDARRPDGWLMASSRLLEGSQETREWIDTNVRGLYNRCAADGGIHDFSHLYKERRLHVGVTIVAAPPPMIDMMIEHLDDYPRLRKYKQRADEWFAVGLLYDNDKLQVHVLHALREPWAYDAQLADEVRLTWFKPINKAGDQLPRRRHRHGARV